MNSAIFQFEIEMNDIILEQNRPNPFAETSEISYYIPKKYQGNVKLVIADESGNQVYQQFDACFGKPCLITISAKELLTGVYHYGVMIDGKLIKSQKMMVIKQNFYQPYP